MKKFTLSFLIIFCLIINVKAISPYFKLGDVLGDLQTTSALVKKSLSENGFKILGEYQPGNNDHQMVIIYSNDELCNTASSINNRGALAAALKVGLIFHDNKTTLSMLNPEYLFYGYFRDEMNDESLQEKLAKVTHSAISAMKNVSNEFTPMGGDVSAKKLAKYHYMIGMPYFDDPVVLNTYNSFEEGVQTIKANLKARKENTEQVYELIFKDKEIAVFGIGMNNQEEGEAHFLPIIGEEHLAAMPYELILQNKEVTMLHGRFRFALHWPELTMGTFTKIMSTPGDVKDMLEAITE